MKRQQMPRQKNRAAPAPQHRPAECALLAQFRQQLAPLLLGRQISSTADDLMALASHLGQQKVDSLKQAIAEGRHRRDPRQIAAAMFADGIPNLG